MRFLLCVIAFLNFTFCLDTQIIKLKIKSVDKKNKTLTLETTTQPLKVGETGIVVHKIGAGIISNSIEITAINSQEIQASYQRFTLLEQKYLPTPVLKPKIGDEVILRSFYQRGFIVAPNLALYETIKNKFPKIHFVNSDLMIADVGNKGIVDPSKKGFQQVCKTYSVGILAIYASNGLNLLDCQSFKVLETQPLENPTPKEAKYPFYARVEAKSFWDFLKSKKDYFKEYDKLLQ